MASINGIEVKNVRLYPDHEGATYTAADVWYKGKKLGHWEQDYMGGPDHFDFDEAILQKEVDAYKNSPLVEEQYKDITDCGILLWDLCHLKEKEKHAKKCYKQGFRTVVFFEDGFHMTWFWTKRDKAEALTCKMYNDTLEECKREFYKNVEMKISAYEEKDFTITLDDKEVERE